VGREVDPSGAVIVDYEAVVADLELFMLEKDGNSFGLRELQDKLHELRVKHRVPEGFVEKALRLYDEELLAALRQRPNTSAVEAAGEMAGSAPVRIGA
jgi:hypothetical protein